MSFQRPYTPWKKWQMLWSLQQQKRWKSNRLLRNPTSLRLVPDLSHHNLPPNLPHRVYGQRLDHLLELWNPVKKINNSCKMLCWYYEICSCVYHSYLTLSQTTNFGLCQTERLCRRQFHIWWKWQTVLQRGRKLWEKLKLLLTSNFFPSYSVFKRLVLQTRKNHGLFGKGLTLYLTTKFWTDLNWKHLQMTNYAIEKLKFILGWVENIVEKGENAGFQHFLLFPQCFQKASFLGLSKVRIV